EPPRQEVVRLDRLTRGILHAAVAHPTVALADGPVVQPDAVARLVVLDLERVERELSARVVEKQVVGLAGVVNARSRRSGFDHVHGNVDARSELLARGRDHALQGADAPGSQSDYRDA